MTHFLQAGCVAIFVDEFVKKIENLSLALSEGLQWGLLREILIHYTQTKSEDQISVYSDARLHSPRRQCKNVCS